MDMGSPTHYHDHGHDHAHGHTHDCRSASRAALLGALALLVAAFIAEVVGGLIAGSLALLADAAHLLTDIAAVLLALLAQWFAGRPAGPTRSFGFRRLEILAALINGVTLWIVAGYVLFEAIARLRQPQPVAALPMIAVAAFGLVVQTIATLVLSRAKGESLNVKGAYVHAATDALQSAAVVAVGLALYFTGIAWLDPAVSLLIAALIAYSGGRIVWEATHVLLEGTPAELDLREIAARICAVAGVRRVSDLHAWSITTGFNALSAHIIAEPTVDAAGRDGLARQLSELVREHYAVHHVTLQVEECCSLDCSGWLRSAAVDEDAR